MPPDDTEQLIACMDLLSKKLRGCVSAVLPTDEHAVFLEHVGALLDELELVRLRRRQHTRES
jgi:hypothetical protein